LSASAFPDTLPGTEYGPDRGIRLSAVWLMHDPAYPESYLYEQDRITVTDSLNRREVLHTEGGAGLKRVVKKEL
ncbi:hypothetical protein U0B06_22290, partial [Escherichia coli]|nr:hypothetical protein [Escherichia coli]